LQLFILNENRLSLVTKPQLRNALLRYLFSRHEAGASWRGRNYFRTEQWNVSNKI